MVDLLKQEKLIFQGQMGGWSTSFFRNIILIRFFLNTRSKKQKTILWPGGNWRQVVMIVAIVSIESKPFFSISCPI